MSISSLASRTFRLAAVATALAAAATTTTVSAQQLGTGYEYTVVSSFGASFIDGRAPSSLRQASDGTFYGTTSAGGVFDRGTLFRMDATGAVTSLHSFSGALDGGEPFGLVRASNGQFYGMTSQGGELGHGTVFRLNPGGAPTTLHAFSETDRSPADLFAASDGKVYGLTGRGEFDPFTIFMIDPGGGVTTMFTVDFRPCFCSSDAWGMRSLVRGNDGRFYVTTDRGGTAGLGTVFAMDDAGTMTILYSFAGRERGDGEAPAGLIQGRDGRLYGTTLGGGSGASSGGMSGSGTVYSLDLTGEYRLLHSFSFDIDGSQPGPDLLEANDGSFYGATQFVDTVFRIDSTGAFTTLYRQIGTPGELIQGADGALYGTTEDGGVVAASGTIFTFVVPGTLTTLHEFNDTDVGRPNGVIQARDGLFYGTTGFPDKYSGLTGTVFAMNAAGARTTLHAFEGGRGWPMSNLFEGNDGSLYGTTFTPSTPVGSRGMIFKISPTGDLTEVYPSVNLEAGVIEARDGRLYGTQSGAPAIVRPSKCCPTCCPPSPAPTPFRGSVFRIEEDGTRTVLHTFDPSGTDGSNPVSELLEAFDGTLYGTTEGSAPSSVPFSQHGTIFRVDPATGSFTTVHRFSGPDGSKPIGRLVQGPTGLIYGTTRAGGAFERGTVFSLDSEGTLTSLHHFSGSPDGAQPFAGLTLGLDGRLYGTTGSGGAFDSGTVFVMGDNGGLTTLHHFVFSDGANPLTELIQANDGAFYGVASFGGPNLGGVIFRIRLAPSLPDRFVEIVSRNSGKCLDVFGASTDAAASVIQWTCHGGPNQQWRLEPADGGAFRIIARHSGQVLDVYGGLVDDVTPVIQFPVHGGDNQVWTLEGVAERMVIFARHSGKVLDVEGASVEDGARVIQYTLHGGENQQWLLRAVAGDP